MNIVVRLEIAIRQHVRNRTCVDYFTINLDKEMYGLHASACNKRAI